MICDGWNWRRCVQRNATYHQLVGCIAGIQYVLLWHINMRSNKTLMSSCAEPVLQRGSAREKKEQDRWRKLSSGDGWREWGGTTHEGCKERDENERSRKGQQSIFRFSVVTVLSNTPPTGIIQGLSYATASRSRHPWLMGTRPKQGCACRAQQGLSWKLSFCFTVRSSK